MIEVLMILLGLFSVFLLVLRLLGKTVSITNVGEDPRIKNLQDELAEVTKSLQESDRQKTEFLAMLSHELRNPLAPITHSIQIINNSKNDGAVEDAKKVIGRQTDHLVRLVDSLLDTQRIQTGKITIKKSIFPIQESLKTAHEAISLLSQKDHLRVILDMPAEDVLINADRTRLDQVFINIFTNSVRFSQENGHLWVKVNVEGNHINIHFQDDGVGIASDLLPKVCEPFVQGEQTLDRPFGGLGVGLTLVKHMIEAHDGKLTINSSGKDQGTIVIIQLKKSSIAADDRSD
jgi:signal transduction histidine kinase